MEELIRKLIEIEEEVSKERGAFALFGLFERKESPGMWDLVVSGTAVGDDTAAFTRYLADRLKASLTRQELLSLSRVVVLSPRDTLFVSFPRSKVKHGAVRFTDCEINGMEIANAVIISLDDSAVPKKIHPIQQRTPTQAEARELLLRHAVAREQRRRKPDD